MSHGPGPTRRAKLAQHVVGALAELEAGDGDAQLLAGRVRDAATPRGGSERSAHGMTAREGVGERACERRHLRRDRVAPA